jgi:hypothetical protein
VAAIAQVTGVGRTPENAVALPVQGAAPVDVGLIGNGCSSVTADHQMICNLATAVRPGSGPDAAASSGIHRHADVADERW